MKTKLMVCSDVIHAGTGFSEELRNVLFRLVQTGEYEVYWIGLQHIGYDMNYSDLMWSDLRHTGATIKMVSGRGPPELYGIRGFKRNFHRFAPDLFLMMGDPQHFGPYVKAKEMVPYPLMAYTTLDGLPIHPSWREIFVGVNVTLAMTEWAMLEFQKAGIPTAGYIHHGVNWQWMVSNKIEKYKVRRSFEIPDDVTLFMSWDANQFRKRYDVLLECWKKFHPESKKALLFLYTDSDCFLGWKMEDLIEQIGVPRHTVLLPEDVYGRRKYFEQAEPMEFHRMICQMGDVYVSATGGEGFGKCPVEAFSLGMPAVITDYSACSEVCEKGSILVPTYEGDVGRFRYHDKIKKVQMGLVNQEKFVEALLRLYDNPEERKELGAQAREWAKTFDYDTQIIPGWLDILSRINPDVMLAEMILK